MFIVMELFVPQYVEDKEMKKMRYHDMMGVKTMEFFSISSCQTLEQMIDRARER